MRVSGEEYLRVSQLRQLRQVNRVSNTPAVGSIATAPLQGSSAAQLEISPEAREVQRVVGVVAQQPEIREDVVASLKARIDSGTYAVTGEQIGEMMLRRMLADQVR